MNNCHPAAPTPELPPQSFPHLTFQVSSYNSSTCTAIHMCTWDAASPPYLGIICLNSKRQKEKKNGAGWKISMNTYKENVSMTCVCLLLFVVFFFFLIKFCLEEGEKDYF